MGPKLVGPAVNDWNAGIVTAVPPGSELMTVALAEVTEVAASNEVPARRMRLLNLNILSPKEKWHDKAALEAEILLNAILISGCSRLWQ